VITTCTFGILRLAVAWRSGCAQNDTVKRLSMARNGILVIAALIAVILLRGESIIRSPKVVATISDSVQLAWMVLEAVERRAKLQDND